MALRCHPQSAQGYPHRCHRWRCHLLLLVGGILLRGVVLLGSRLRALAVIAGIGGGAALGGALGIAFGVAHSLVVARCADQVGGGSPQAFTRLGVGINGSVGSAYRCGIRSKSAGLPTQVDGFVHIHNGHIALANIDLAGGIAALAVFIQIVQAQGFQRGTLLPVDLFALPP